MANLEPLNFEQPKNDLSTIAEMERQRLFPKNDYKPTNQSAPGRFTIDYPPKVDFIHNQDYDGDIEKYLIYPNWCITDVRFPNEADAVTERGGKLIKVIRYKVGDKVWFNDESEPDEDKNQSGEYEIIGIHSNEEYLISNGTTEMGAWNYEINHINKDTHASEVEQDNIVPFYTIHNSTTLEDLIESVKYIMIEEGVIKV